MILLIDDAKDGTYADYVARNAMAGKMLLNKLQGLISELHIDFDLGSQSANGLEVLNYGLVYGYVPNTVWVVSMNPDGRKALENLLLDNGFIGHPGGKFERKVS